jgi:hypothetical protein
VPMTCGQLIGHVGRGRSSSKQSAAGKMSTGTTWAPPCPPLAAPIGLGAGISHASFPPYGTEYSHASGYSSIRVLADPTRRNQGGEGETTVNVVGILRCRCAGTPGFRRSYSLRNAEAGVCHSQSSSHRIASPSLAWQRLVAAGTERGIGAGSWDVDKHNDIPTGVDRSRCWS